MSISYKVVKSHLFVFEKLIIGAQWGRSKSSHAYYIINTIQIP